MSLHPVVILAGGLATRLRPITEKIPKALVNIGGKPFIYHQLRLLRSRGIQHVIISAWYRGEMIRDYVRDGEQFDMKVDYVFDGDFPLGTGGAIRQALPLLKSPFFVLYGDSYLPCNYEAIQAYFDEQKKPGLMTIFYNRDKWDVSNVEMKNSRIIRYDKQKRTPEMKYIDYGLGMLIPSVLHSIQPGQPADLAEIYQRLISENQLLAYEAKERFYEVGSMEGLTELEGILESNPNQFLKMEQV